LWLTTAFSFSQTAQDLGKTFIIGQLTKVEATKLTIHRPDGVDQTIAVDANTKFLDSNRNAITLADLKAGDRIAGVGALKDGVFVPTELRKAPNAPPPLPF